VKVEKQEGEAVIIPDGRIDISNSQELKEKMQLAFDEGYNVIAIDFTHISSIDSSGVGKLLLFQKKLRDRGGELRVYNITSEYVRKMFNMIHLYKVINIEQ